MISRSGWWWLGVLVLGVGCGPSPTEQTGWGVGTATGTLAGDLWTPARDADGRVSFASWDTVPKGRWIEVEDTRIDRLDSAVRTAVKGWSTADLWWPAVTNSWSWPAIDLAGVRFWLGPSGGNTEGGNNGLYRFDVYDMGWAIESPPSDISLWSTEYRAIGTSGGSYTECKESDDLRKKRIEDGVWKDVNDISGDEIFWDYPDHAKPTARRVFRSLVYAENQNALFLTARRLWKYDLVANKWSYRRDILALDGDNATGDELVTVYDEVKKRLMHRGGGATPRNMVYDVANNQFGNEFPAMWETVAPIAERHDRNVVVVKLPQSGGTLGGYHVYNLDARGTTIVGDAFQLGDGLTQDLFSPSTYTFDHGGLVYIPPLERYWVWARFTDGVLHPLEIDPTTTPWTLRLLTQTGSVVPREVVSADGHPIPKPIWFPKLNAVVFMNTYQDRIAIYRL